MPLINFGKNEIQCKIVYYGCGFCGKTTTLLYIYNKTMENIRGKMVSIDTDGDRTIFFDFLSINLGKIRGFDIRVQLYTVPGQVHYDTTRKLVLRGVDGVVFVADSPHKTPPVGTHPTTVPAQFFFTTPPGFEPRFPA